MKLSSSSSAKYNDEALRWFKDIKLNKKIKKRGHAKAWLSNSITMKNLIKIVLGFSILSVSSMHGQLYVGDNTTMYLGAGSSLHIPGTTEISSTNGLLQNAGGTLILQGALTGASQLQLDAAANLEIDNVSVTLANQTNEEFNNLVLTNDATLVVSAGNSLLVTQINNANTDAGVILEAGASGYSQLKVTSYLGSGLVRQQQYLSGEGWHQVSSAVSGNFASDFGTVGTSLYPNAQNLFTWDPVTGNYVNVADGTVSLQTGSGYYAYFGLNGVMSGAGPWNFDVNGSLITSSAVALDYVATPLWSSFRDPAQADGWNLIANPFSCVMDYSTIDHLNIGINNAFYIWDASTNAYKFYSAGGISNPYIAPLQSVWVQATSSSVDPTLPLTMAGNAAIITSGTPAYFKSNSTFDRVVLRSHLQSDSSSNDYTVVPFINGTSNDYDAEWDAHKFMNAGSNPNIYSTSGTQVLAVNAIDYGPLDGSHKTLDLSFSAPSHGANYTIYLDNSFLNNYYTLELEDSKMGIFHDLSNGTYDFVFDSLMLNRFTLHINRSSVGQEEDLVNAGFDVWQNENGQINYNILSAGNYNFSLMSLNGAKLWETSGIYSSAESGVLTIDKNLPPCVYILRIHSSENGMVLNRKIVVK